MPSDATQFRRDFWTRYAELYPDDGVPSGWGRSYVWIPVESVDLNVSLAVYPWGVGLWLRGAEGRIAVGGLASHPGIPGLVQGRADRGIRWPAVPHPRHRVARRFRRIRRQARVRRKRPGQLARYGGMASLYAANLHPGNRERSGPAGIVAARRPPKFRLTCRRISYTMETSAPWQYVVPPACDWRLARLAITGAADPLGLFHALYMESVCLPKQPF